MAGHAIGEQANKIMCSGCRTFIQKPFTIAELSESVREILDGPIERKRTFTMETPMGPLDMDIARK